MFIIRWMSFTFLFLVQLSRYVSVPALSDNKIKNNNKFVRPQNDLTRRPVVNAYLYCKKVTENMSDVIHHIHKLSIS